MDLKGTVVRTLHILHVDFKGTVLRTLHILHVDLKGTVVRTLHIINVDLKETVLRTLHTLHVDFKGSVHINVNGTEKRETIFILGFYIRIPLTLHRDPNVAALVQKSMQSLLITLKLKLLKNIF